MVLSPEAEGSVAQIIFGLMRLREMKPIYFWCKLAEGRIEIFHVVRLRGTKQIPFLRSAAEGSVAQTIFGRRS